MNSPRYAGYPIQHMSKNIKKIGGTRPRGASSKSITSVPAPAALGVSARASKPFVNGSDSFRIHRREFVGSVTNFASTTFVVAAGSLATPGYDFNPSVARMFPWLSQIAPAFERFRFNNLKFDFIPGQSTNTAGRYYAAVDYDYDDAVATTKATLMGNMTSVEASIWQTVSMTCDPKALNRDLPYRYVSCTTRGQYVENRTAFSGYLIVAFDTPVAQCLVDIWVEYDVELTTPVADDLLQQSLQFVTAADVPAIPGGLAPAAGAFFGNYVLPLNSTFPSGPITLAAAGVGGNPVFKVPLGAGVEIYPPYALDLKNTAGMGDIVLYIINFLTGETPIAMMDTKKLLSKWAFLDSLGASVASSTTTSLKAISSQGYTLGAGAVINNFVQSTIGISLLTLASLFPSARFAVPYNIADVAAGAGSAGFGFSITK